MITDYEKSIKGLDGPWESLAADEDNGNGTATVYATHHGAAAEQVLIRKKNAPNVILWRNASPFTLGGVRLKPFTSDYPDTVYDKAAVTSNNLTRYRKRSPLATLRVRTDTTTPLDVSFVSVLANSGFAGADSYISYYDSNWKFLGYINPAANSLEQTLPTIDLPGTGFRDFYFVESGNTQSGPNDFVGTFITKIAATTGTIQIVPQARAANRILVVADSIYSSGDGSSNNSRYGALVHLRRMLGATWTVTSDGWGGRHHHGSLNSPQLQQEQAERILSFFAGATGRKVLLWPLGTNDFGVSTIDPALVAQYADAVWALVLAADPTIEILLITPLWRANRNTANSGGWILSQYATALTNAAVARGIKVRNGLLPLEHSTKHFTGDNLHPNDTGMKLLAQDTFNVIMQPAIPAEVNKNAVIIPGEILQDNADPNQKVTYTGTFSPSSVSVANGGTIRLSTATHAQYEFKFYGEQAKLHFHQNDAATGGSWEVLVNGVVEKTINNKQSSNQAGHYYVTKPQAIGTHTVTVRKTDPESGDAIWFDAAEGLFGATHITKISWEPDPPLPISPIESSMKVQDNDDNASGYIKYYGTFTSFNVANADGGTIRFSNTAGNYYEFQVDGRQFKLFFHLDTGTSGGIWNVVKVTTVNNVETETVVGMIDSRHTHGTPGNYFVCPDLGVGIHTIRIKQTKSTVTPIWFDAVEVLTGFNTPSGTFFNTPLIVVGEKYQDNATLGKVKYIGDFASYGVANADGGTIKHSSAKDSAFQLRFSGEQFRLFFHRESGGGLWDIVVDKVLVATVDTRNSTSQWGQHYTSPAFQAGEHVVTVKQNQPGTINPIWFDAFEVLTGATATPGTSF